MTTIVAPRTEAQALYPPSVDAPPRPLPLRRFLLTFVRNPLSSLPRPVYEEPIVFHDNGRGGIAWVTDPALVEQVLLHGNAQFPKTALEKRVFAHTLGEGILTSEGASWRWQRRTAAPLFRPADLSGLVPLMTAAAEDQVARWRNGPAGTVRAIDRDMTETTFHVISATMFAGSADAEAAAILKSADTALATISWDIAAAMLRLPAWMWYPGKFKRRRAARTLRAAVATILERRRAAGLEGDDLLARLARAQDPETGEPMSEKAAHRQSRHLPRRRPRDHRQGADLDALSSRPRPAMAGAHPGRDRHGRRCARCRTRSTSSGCPITRAVLKEAMRLYPPAPVMTRLAAQDMTLGPATIKAGTLIVVPIFAVHRHRKLWEDPDRFDPQRFAPEREAKLARTQFMPFGFGPRTCIGGTFAMMEATAILATLVRRARFEWDGVHAPEPISRVTLRPKGGMPLHVWLRE